MSQQGLFGDNWLELQRQYWDGLTEMSRKALGMAGGGPAPAAMPWPGMAWEQAMDQWWKALSPAASNPARDFMERLMEQGKAFFRMAESLGAGAAGAGSASDAATAWSNMMGDMQKRFSGALGDGDAGLQRLMSFWELPLDNWQRMMSSMSPLPGDFLRNMPHDQVKSNLNRALSAPGLGYTREEQSQYQDLMRRSMDYQQALQEYTAFYARLGTKSVERMGTYIQGVIDSGKSIDSARALYDNWVACCEAVYAEEVSTPEYARIHGHLINAEMAFKKRMSIMVDETLGGMNMPSRSELRTLQDRLQETRRENKALNHRLHLLEKRIAAQAAPAPGGGETIPTAIRAPAPVESAPARRRTTATRSPSSR